MKKARLADRRHCIDDNDGGDTVPILDQCQSVAAAFEDASRRRHTPAQSLCDSRPKAVVTTVRVANCDDEDRELIGARHVRCTCSFKKCAAQEMHGSWLRMLCSHRAFSDSSSRSSPAVATSRRSSSMTSWFCAVGGTREASRIVPSASRL